jgi:hypothetical protein
VPTIPTVGTGATDMSFTRAKGIQCFGFGPAIDMEDAPRGFGAHSDRSASSRASCTASLG